MDKSLARNFAFALKYHPFVNLTAPERVVDFLTAMYFSLTNLHEPSKIYEEFPRNEFPIEATAERGPFSAVYLRRVLRNELVKYEEPTILGEISRRLTPRLGIRDSNILLKKVFQDRGLVKLIQGCSSPFSIVGYLESCRAETESKREATIIRPLVLIPNTPGKQEVLDWETFHTKEY